jgi:hypothetical protein
MNWVKRHVDTVIVLGGIVSSILWMNHKFTQVDNRFVVLEKDMAVMKAVLMVKGHFPPELITTRQEIENGK